MIESRCVTLTHTLLPPCGYIIYDISAVAKSWTTVDRHIQTVKNAPISDANYTKNQIRPPRYFTWNEKWREISSRSSKNLEGGQPGF